MLLVIASHHSSMPSFVDLPSWMWRLRPPQPPTSSTYSQPSARCSMSATSQSTSSRADLIPLVGSFLNKARFQKSTNWLGSSRRSAPWASLNGVTHTRTKSLRGSRPTTPFLLIQRSWLQIFSQNQVHLRIPLTSVI